MMGLNVNVKAPAEAVPVAVITQEAGSIVPGADINLVCAGFRMAPQVIPPTLMLLAAIASDACCFGPVTAIKTSEARDLVK
jgi:hypothetical protein